MTFFNKKTEVMQIEMTPYGRYLYSIGKFMPHSYEFVDDDILYRASGSTEAQEAAHSRILNETPKTKINRAFQDEAPQVKSPPLIDTQRVMIRKNNMRQADIYPMGRSAYSGSQSPLLQLKVLQGQISGSQMTHTISEKNTHGHSSECGELLIPQIDLNFNFIVSLKDSLDPQDDYDGPFERSELFDDGTYLEIRYQEPILHLKEFNSFYEKENFIIEAFSVSGSSGKEVLTPLKMGPNDKDLSEMDLAKQEDPLDNFDFEGFYEEEEPSPDFLEFFFDINNDEYIPQHILCKVVNSLEINSQFLDDELICPDERMDRFDIYGTRVKPEDLEDCD
jgi:hypothetical protein